ncbi:MAG: CHAT domain-containing protein [Leptolyngbya sp. SIO1E4]|nr:CHAT domain-containing protein [Leptolyngbya sp. SIO1E4]
MLALKGGWQGLVRWMLLGCLSFAMAVAIPAGLPLLPGVTSALTVVTVAAAETPQALLRQGMAHYEADQFQAALQQWQQAHQGFTAQSDRWGQALALSYQSLAHQQLGELGQAEHRLTESLHTIEPVEAGAGTPEQMAIYAKVLNTQGKLHWLEGNVEAALAVWQRSEQAYHQAGDTAGVAIAQINQARVLQHLGFNSQAQTVLQQVYQTLQQQPDMALKATGLRHLSGVLRQIGELDTARSLLQNSLSLTPHPDSTGLIFLELGNTEWAIANRLMAIGQQAEAQPHLQAALTAYQQAIDTDNVLSARLNLLRFWIDQGEWTAAIQAVPTVQQAIDPLPPSRTTVYANIHLAESVLKLIQLIPAHEATASAALPSDALHPLAVAERLSAAFKHAQTLADKQAESYALGQLGRVYEQTQQWAEAQSLTEQALFTLETIQAPELQYRWEWQLGRLRQKQHDQPGAIRAYEAAVNSLQRVRNDLLNVNAEVQFSFRDDVEPVYRQYIELLLTSSQAADPQPPQLEQAIQTVDQLQLAEIENYLGCALTQVQRVDQVQDPQAAILYPIVLSDRVAMVAQLPGAATPLTYHETLVPQATLDATLLALQTNLAAPQRTPEVLADAQKVYDWVLRPIEAELSQASVQTLIFVLDGTMRNIPMSVLHDGNQYLIEKGYAVAIAPRLQMFAPRATRPALKVKMGGIGIPQVINETQFPPIAKLREELEGIAQYVDVSEPLMDESFTTDNIRQQLQRGDFSAIHWKTHGVFSSDPQETYIVAYNEQIVAQDLNNLIQIGSRNGARPLELVVLSACETAQGDDRAVLGLAGLATRTGTRSVLSTLWIAQDTPNTDFMIRFYENLSQSDRSIAESVRQAQLALMNEYGYTTPYIWANYVLVGNWL